MIAKYFEKVIREALCEMIIVDEMPFMTMEGKGFQKLLRVLEPRFKVLSRYTVMKDCVKLYMRDKNMLVFSIGYILDKTKTLYVMVAF
jgi:hypothetical protein